MNAALAILAALAGLALLVNIVWEAFETIVLPRSVTRGFRLVRFFYVTSWDLWRAIGRRVPAADGRRQLFMGIFGPVSLPVLLTMWALGLVLCFALLQYAEAHTRAGHMALDSFATDLYMSGVTFFTLGYGDVLPRTPLAKLIAVTEAGLGFGFLALVIGYLPVLYQAFSRREATISRLDARASSPPSATELVRRFAQARSMPMLATFLYDWEQWASELLESHLSYPVLMFYRSQHEHQSWLSAMTAIMDTCALLLAGVDDTPDWLPELTWQARLTFAMTRHAVIDLAYVVNADPTPPDPDRLPPEDLEALQRTLAGAGVPLCGSEKAAEKLTYLRGLYEPYVQALADRFVFTLPPWLPDKNSHDNWETSAWDHTIPHF